MDAEHVGNVCVGFARLDHVLLHSLDAFLKSEEDTSSGRSELH
jgi:hypothetical protein